MADLHRFRTRADISRSDRRARRPPHRRPLRLRRRARRIRHPAWSRRRRPCGVAEGQTRPGAGARADASGAAGGVIGVEFFQNGGGGRQQFRDVPRIANCRVVGERLKSTRNGSSRYHRFAPKPAVKSRN